MISDDALRYILPKSIGERKFKTSINNEDNMKKSIIKILSLLLVLAVCFSLSSCYLLDTILSSGEGSGGEGGGESNGPGTADQSGGGTINNIQGGDNYEVNITPGESQNILAASKALLSSVSVWCTFNCYQYGWTGQVSGTTQKTGTGSGVIYEIDKENGDAYILTNYHVVYEATSTTANRISSDITVFLYGQEVADYAIKAEYIGGSMQYDLALLKISGSEVLMKSPAVAAEFADSNDIAVLETAIAIGNPEGEGISATVGHVNVESEYINMLASDNSTSISIRVIRTDAAVNGGNSGGGLFNSEGKLIGIVNAKMADDSIDNIGYAIPSNVARGVAENIKTHCLGTEKECVYKCLLGVTVAANEQYVKYDTETGKVKRYEKIAVQTVNEGSAVDGILAVGDVINSITIDGVKYDITRLHHVIDSMLYARVGSKIVINITRASETTDVEIEAKDAMFTDYK